MFKRPSPYYYLFIILVGVYLGLLFSIPPDATTLTRFDISASTARLLSLMVVIPYIAIWFAAFYGFIKVKQYAQLIRSTKDGKGLALIGDGLMVIAIYLPLTSIASTTRSLVATQDSSLRPVTTIIYNYLALSLVLVGFFLISKGARLLMGTLKRQKLTTIQKLQLAATIVFSVIYAYATMTSPNRHTSPNGFFLPDWLILTTIVIPYLVVWFFGFGAAFYLQQYRRNAKGLLYKEALRFLSSGIVFIVGSLILIRMLNVMSSLFQNATLKVLLAILYALLLIVAVGYIYVALGAKRLKKIEEI